LIVLAVTALTACFVLMWTCSPDMRRQIEAPKYSVLRWQDRNPDAEPATQED
jgi:hypothetical protein